jgi:hypothetical protein
MRIASASTRTPSRPNWCLLADGEPTTWLRGRHANRLPRAPSDGWAAGGSGPVLAKDAVEGTDDVRPIVSSPWPVRTLRDCLVTVSAIRLVGRGIDVSDVWHGSPFPPPRRDNPTPTPSAPVTGLSSPSTIPTAICGSSRRSPLGSQAGSTPRKRHSRPRMTWRTRFGVPRPPTSSTRSEGAVAPFSPVEPRRDLARLLCLLHGGGAGRE